VVLAKCCGGLREPVTFLWDVHLALCSSEARACGGLLDVGFLVLFLKKNGLVEVGGYLRFLDGCVFEYCGFVIL
jgi:hypothetical protein